MNNCVVRLNREHMEDIPNGPLPKGFRIRSYRQGEGHIWTRIQRAAEPFLQIGDELFEREFGRHLQALEDRSFFLVTDAGEDIATITSWWQPYWRSTEWGHLHDDAGHAGAQGSGFARSQMITAMRRLKQTKALGLLHWAAIHPKYQGRGLFKPLLAVALRRI